MPSLQYFHIKLNLLLKLLFYPPAIIHNNLSPKICCESIIKNNIEK